MQTLLLKFGAILAIAPLTSLPVTLSDAEAEAIGVEAYIYGYPLVTMDITRKVMTNTVVPEDNKAPMGQFYNARTYPDASFKSVTAPNADTLYSFSWVNLEKEPYILHVPDENGRYYLMPQLSGWTNVYAVPGTRTTGTKEADFAITGPNWKGTLPSGVTEFKAPTNLVWVLGRTYCTGTPEDYEAVHAIQDKYSLTPLSSYGKPYTPPNGVVDPNFDMKTPVRDQVNNLDAGTFFKQFASLLKNNPPATEDSAIVANLAKIGIVPGQDFDIKKVDPKIAKSLERAPKIALEKILAHNKSAGKYVNGWTFSTNTGLYGTNYLQRAYIAFVGLGANRPEDAVYPMTNVDVDGKPLNGKNNYVLHFNKDQIPPVRGFWSLTMYNDQYFFVANPLTRYNVSPRNNLKYNSDGSLDLYIQNANPGKDKEPNWLPAPTNSFVLMLRLYWLEESVISGTWKPSGVRLVK